METRDRQNRDNVNVNRQEKTAEAAKENVPEALLHNLDNLQSLVVSFREKPSEVVAPGGSIRVQPEDGVSFYHRPRSYANRNAVERDPKGVLIVNLDEIWALVVTDRDGVREAVDAGCSIRVRSDDVVTFDFGFEDLETDDKKDPTMLDHPWSVTLKNNDDHRELVVTYRDRIDEGVTVREEVVVPGDSIGVDSTHGVGFFHRSNH